MITELLQILESKFPNENWKIEPPKKGFSKNRRFVARGASMIFFVRIGDNLEIAETLAKAGLGLPIIFSGYLSTKTSFYFEKFISFKHPDSMWFIDNMEVIVEKIKKFQAIRTLNAVLQKKDYVSEIEKEYNNVPYHNHYRREMSTMIEDLKQSISNLQEFDLVMCHGDFGSNNMLVHDCDLFMIDWETLHLSDPIRDIAHLIYWCYPEKYWQKIIGLFGYDIQDQKFKDKFFWHVLSRSLYVYLLFVNSSQGELAIDFYYDALNASNYKPASRLLA